VGKYLVGRLDTYPWTIFDDIETRDAAMFGDHCDAFFQKTREADKPFHLTVGFHDPHRDQSRGGFGSHVDTFDERFKDLDVTMAEVEVPDWLTDVPELRQELVEYYWAINRFDQGTGFILDGLTKKGFADDTLVIITSDNGISGLAVNADDQARPLSTPRPPCTTRAPVCPSWSATRSWYHPVSRVSSIPT
jgi:N-sulfoglucosamine sulfohydrolase